MELEYFCVMLSYFGKISCHLLRDNHSLPSSLHTSCLFKENLVERNFLVKYPVSCSGTVIDFISIYELSWINQIYWQNMKSQHKKMMKYLVSCCFINVYKLFWLLIQFPARVRRYWRKKLFASKSHQWLIKDESKFKEYFYNHYSKKHN